MIFKALKYKFRCDKNTNKIMFQILNAYQKGYLKIINNLLNVKILNIK